MKSLKKLSRNELKNVKGSGPANPSFETGNCGDSCGIGDGVCERYGLSCGFFALTNGQGIITSTCMKCM